MGFEADKARFQAAPPRAVWLGDGRDGPDCWGVAEAMRPFAELALTTEAETPLAFALVGVRGAGKSFALRRLVERIEASAGGPGLVGKVVVAEVDAASGDPAGIAAAVFEALQRDYSALAEEAAQATVDPGHAATTSAARHDEIAGRLEQERRARDEVEARRARLSDALLRETPGSRVDAFVRANRAPIEQRLRGFGFDGDADVNFRSLVGDLGGAQRRSRLGVFLRSLWAYRGQTRLIVLAIVAFALAFGLDRLRSASTQEALASFSAGAAPAIEAVKAHDEGLGYLGEALLAVGVLALVANVWRAARFTRLLFQGLRMLKLDVGERRRELDASAARLERRVAALQIEADAAGQRAEAMAQRAGSRPNGSRPQTFADVADGPERAARAFLDDLGRAMSAAVTPAPQRIVLAMDGFGGLPAPAARRFLETAKRIVGRGFVVIAAVDLTPFDDPREAAETLFDAVYDVAPDAGAVAPWLASARPPEAATRRLSEPLDETEAGYLKTASELIGPRPRVLKKFYNAYRLARVGDAPRGVLALSLAALMAADSARAVGSALSGEAEAPSGPSALAAAFGELAQGVDQEAARRAFEAARRYAPWGSPGRE